MEHSMVMMLAATKTTKTRLKKKAAPPVLSGEQKNKRTVWPRDVYRDVARLKDSTVM